ncbi:MAG: glycosyltransferase family 2 protein [Gemmatimonadales bacterium]|nr:glycosyltransferase family 2 protein [Gemmatimonadales bacterium]
MRGLAHRRVPARAGEAAGVRFRGRGGVGVNGAGVAATETVSPHVSILLPCRDAEPFLGACIESLAAQSEPRFEVLALDDGSRDGTGPLLRAFAIRHDLVPRLERSG